MWKCKLLTEQQTRTWGSFIEKPCVIAIDGDLGSGKTVFAQGIGVGLGIQEPIVSPTFIIANQYQSLCPFLHIDLYRLEAEDLFTLGLDEEIENWPGVVLIEWASKYPHLLPHDHLHVWLGQSDHPDQRMANVQAFGNTFDFLSEWKEKWMKFNAST